MQRKALKKDSMKKKRNLKRNYNIERSVEIGLDRGLGEKKKGGSWCVERSKREEAI
jgi:hypothetical protein